MPQLVFFNEAATPQQVTSVTGPSVNQGPFVDSGRTDFVIAPDLSALEGIVLRKYWKHSGGLIISYTAAEITTQDAAEAAAQAQRALDDIAAIRADAAEGLSGFDVSPLVLRAFAEILIDEINTLRALHSLGDRTLLQLKNAITNTVNSGDVDDDPT